MKNVIWSLISTFLSKGFSTVFVIVLGNLLLPTDLGIYVAVMLMLSYAVTLLSMNISSAIVQKLNDVNLKEVKAHYFSVGWIAVSIVSLSVISLMYLFKAYLLDIFNLQNEGFLLVSLPLVCLQMNAAYFNRVLQASLKIRLQMIINLFSTVVLITSSLLFISAGYGLYGIIAGVYLGNLVGVIAEGYFAFKMHGLILDKTIFKVKVVKDLLRFSSLIHIGAMAVFLDKNVDVFFINYFLSKDQLAIYNYALKLALLIVLFGGSVSRVTYPKLSNAFSSDASKEVDLIYSMSINFSFLILSTISLVLIFHIEYLIALILPQIYLEMIPPYTILLIGVVLFASFAAVGTIFTAKGIPGYGVVSVWLALGVNILLNLILIPRYGTIGGALATSTSFLARVIIGMILVEYRIKTSYRYFGIAFAYGLLICLAILGRFVLDSLAMRELFIAVFVAASFPLLLGDEERQFLKKIILGFKTNSALLKRAHP